MLPTWMNSAVARLAQDLLTSLAAYLTAQGIITNDQQAGFVGSGFFLFMLLVNIVLHKIRGADAAVAIQVDRSDQGHHLLLQLLPQCNRSEMPEHRIQGDHGEREKKQ